LDALPSQGVICRDNRLFPPTLFVRRAGLAGRPHQKVSSSPRSGGRNGHSESMGARRFGHGKTAFLGRLFPVNRGPRADGRWTLPKTLPTPEGGPGEPVFPSALRAARSPTFVHRKKLFGPGQRMEALGGLGARPNLAPGVKRPVPWSSPADIRVLVSGGGPLTAGNPTRANRHFPLA